MEDRIEIRRDEVAGENERPGSHADGVTHSGRDGQDRRDSGAAGQTTVQAAVVAAVAGGVCVVAFLASAGSRKAVLSPTGGGLGMDGHLASRLGLHRAGQQRNQ